MTGEETLVDLLMERAETGGSAGYHFLRVRDMTADDLSYRALAEDASIIADGIASTVALAERVVLVYPPGLEFLRALFATLTARVIAVPVAPPSGDFSAWLNLFQRIVTDAEPSAVLTTADFRAFKDGLAADGSHTELSSGGLPWLTTEDLSAGDPSSRSGPTSGRRVQGNDIAYLQYTSGSTAFPKGVVLRHHHLLANLRSIKESFRFNGDSRMGSWLPMFHDMGLVGGVLEPLYSGIDSYLMSPVDFLQRPVRWLDMISRFGITISGGPNFAYNLCVRRVDPETCLDLDLRSWKVAFNGAEVVHPNTIDRFCEAFVPVGLEPRAFLPCYGLAEATLLVSGVDARSDPVIVTADREALERGHYVNGQGHDSMESRRLVSVGQPTPDVETAIVGADARALRNGQVGEIWVRGPSVAGGYWRGREPETFEAYLADGTGPFLRTGDLGFTLDGELFISGRRKEVIILRGRNIFPQDIEEAAHGGDPRLRAGCGAAFSLDTADGELAALVQEVQSGTEELEEVVAAIKGRVSAALNLPLAAIALVPPRTIPKTTSGKLRRLETRDAYLAGQLPALKYWSTLPSMKTSTPAGSTSSDGR